MTNKLISVMIMSVIGLALLPVVADFVEDLTQAEVLDIDGTTVLEPAGAFYNTTTGSLIDLLPILYVIILITGMIVYVKIKK